MTIWLLRSPLSLDESWYLSTEPEFVEVESRMTIEPGGPPLPPSIPRPQVSNMAFCTTATYPPVRDSPVVHSEKEIDLKLTC